MILDALTVGIPFIPLMLNGVNHHGWPRPRTRGTAPDRVSVLIPARNEEAAIEGSVRAALRVSPPVLEVIVCDDDSTDDTPRILADLQATDARLKVIRGGPLPPGWVGKPHACHHLGKAATGDVLLFVDADTQLAQDATERLGQVFDRYNARVITAFPHQRYGSTTEQLVVPMLGMTFTSWLPLDLIWKHVDPRLLVVNGQVLAFRREAYEIIGGFASVRDAIVDDMAICRRAKTLDQRVVFADGQDVASTRMYAGGHEVWQGFSKNFFPGLGASLPALVFVLTTMFFAWVFPFLRLAVELALHAPSAPSVAGVLFALSSRALLARRFHDPAWTVFAIPLSALALMAIGLNSARWTLQGSVAWKGRTYD